MKLTRRGRVVVTIVVTLVFMVALGYAGHIETLGY
jgi:hypothetical protein